MAAGPLAALYVGAVRSTPGTNVRVVGIIEDAGTPRGRYVHDVPVLGGPEDLDRIVAELAVQGIHPQRLVLTRTAERLPLGGTHLRRALPCPPRRGAALPARHAGRARGRSRQRRRIRVELRPSAPTSASAARSR